MNDLHHRYGVQRAYSHIMPLPWQAQLVREHVRDLHRYFLELGRKPIPGTRSATRCLHDGFTIIAISYDTEPQP